MEDARTFTNRLADLLSRERTALGEFLVQLAEFDRGRMWVELGYASLFDFLHRELGLSKTAASFRKKAAELVQRFPDVAGPLRDGRLCLTSVFELAKVLTPENRDEVLPRFFQLSRREAKSVSAELQPRDAVATKPDPSPTPAPAGAVFVPLPPASGCGSEPLRTEAVCPGKLLGAEVSAPPARSRQPARPAAPRSEVEPLTGDLSRLHVTVSSEFVGKLEAARAALSHSHPGAGIEEILEAGLDLVLERHARRRGLVKRPRAEPPPAAPEHVPAHVKRAVWTRDGGVCQWPLEGGGICGSTHQVELDHVEARGRGGPSTIENTRTLCRFHNDLAARREYGDAWMDRFTEGWRPRPAPLPAEGGPPSGAWSRTGRRARNARGPIGLTGDPDSRTQPTLRSP